MSEPVRVLVVDDNPFDAELMVRELRNAGLEFVCSVATNREGLESALAGEPSHDIVLCDYDLPDLDGLGAIAIIRERDPLLPVVIVTGSISEEVAVDCIKAGAIDYVLKSNLTRLPVAARYALEYARLRRVEEDRQRAIERSRDFYMTLLREFPNPVWRLDERRRCDFVNRAWIEFTGRTLEQELGDGWQAGIHPDDLASYRPVVRRHFEAREPFALEYRLRHVDGTYHAVVSHGRPIYDPGDGRFVGYVGACFDLEEVRRAEAGERLLATAVDAAAEAIVITDADGVIQYVNPAFEEVSGYTLDEVLDQTPGLVSSGEHDASFYEELWSTISSGKTWRGHIVNRRKDGTLYEEDVSISPVFAHDGTIINYVGVKRDLSRERDLESRLLQSQKLDAIGRLAGGVAHDFNNLLGVITGYADLLEDDLDPGHPARRRLEQIQRATASATALTKQLLAFGRRQVLRPIPADLNMLVNEITGMTRRLLPATISLELELDSTTPFVVVDRSQIEQVILNLALNARDAMAKGGTIRFATSRCDEPAGFACLSVSDTGVGISSEQLQHMFEPFYTTKSEGKGTGLGLATVYGIVRQSGGDVSVESEPGRGSTFRVYLPLAPVGTELPDENVAASSDGLLGDSGCRVLLVEDQGMLREMIHEGLETAGCTVISAAGGAEALALVGDHQGAIDLLVTDVVMPGMSGRELARRLRVGRPDLPVLFMSGYSGDIISGEKILEEGVDLLQKPFTIDVLMERIQSLLRRGGSDQ